MQKVAAKGPTAKAKKTLRRTYGEIFLDKVKALSADAQSLVSNKTLREALDWDEEKYLRIKAQLIAEDLLIVGRGYGGSVGLATAPGRDEAFLDVASHVRDRAVELMASK